MELLYSEWDNTPTRHHRLANDGDGYQDPCVVHVQRKRDDRGLSPKGGVAITAFSV